ncbi:MAG: translation initiation factor IF-2 N-terminal domain-containing protein, partial [Lachnospiraceae bacterium]|nr:translation initiation factor IF-2 N-terminal domain-containing protein [Lachnospiraceae bacterium]
MAKIKVHNLAGEVGISNKELVAYLKEKGYEAITAVSLVPDSEIAGIRAKFGASDETASEQPKAETTVEKAESAAVPSEEPDEGKPKKSGFVRVFRSQNATKQLQRRPRKPQAAPTKAPEEKPEPKEEPVVSAAPKEVRAEPASEAVSENIPAVVSETVAEKAPEAAVPETAAPVKETKPVPHEEAVPEKTPESVSEAPAE